MANQPLYQIQALLEKLNNPDSDFRFMSLNDLHSHLMSNSNPLSSDAGLSSRVVDGVIKALDDANGEVQNLAVKCLGPLVLKVKETQIAPILDRLAQLAINSTDPSIPSTALRTVISNLPRPGCINAMTGPVITPAAAQNLQIAAAATNAISRHLIPKLLAMLGPDAQKGANIDSVDVLVEVLRCFGGILGGAEVEQFQVKVMGILENDRSSGVVKKRAVTALSLLCVYSPDILLSSFISHLIESFKIEGTSPQRIRLYVSVTGAMARAIPDRFGPYLRTLAPFILGLVNGKDLEDQEFGDEPDMEQDELKEAALVALEAFQSMCPGEMRRFTAEVLAAGIRFLKYDPNYADPGEGDEDMDAEEEEEEEGYDGEDFEEDGNFSDEDDISWKVRRCSAKLLSTVIRTRAGDLLEDGTLYKEVAPILVDRFMEREENVRLEVLATATVLVRKTGEISTAAAPSGSPTAANRKRRREPSDVSAIEAMVEDRTSTPIQIQGPTASLASLIPKISKALAKTLKGKAITLSTKQASITLLLAIVDVLHGGLQDVLASFIEPIIDATKGGTGFLSGQTHTAGATALGSISGAGVAASATGSSLRIEVLKLVGKTCAEHPRQVVEPYLKDLVPAVVAAIQERFYKISSQALSTAAEIIKMLTAEGHEADGANYLDHLYNAILQKISSSETDLEVRERAIYCMGILLSRTSATAEAISNDKRQAGLDVLLERLRNETTRVTAARAIDLVAKNAKTTDDLRADWVSEVVTELGAQLRKVNRSLRGASLDGLRSIVSNEFGRALLTAEARNELLGVLTPLLVLNDLHLLGPALIIMRLLIETKQVAVIKPMVEAVCSLVKTHQGSGSTLNNVVSLVNAIGRESEEGKTDLMMGLLKDVGVLGETAVVAKVIGNLLVSGGGKQGGLNVGVEDFVIEMKTAGDDHRKCLALMVLGEAGLKMGPSFPIGPEVFLEQFQAKSEDVPIAAAVALGLAGAGSVEKYLPVIMQSLQANNAKDQYLLLHSLKEIIQHSNSTTADIKPYAKHMWSSLFAIAKNDDSKAVGAECVGRLTIIDPYSFLPELQKHLNSSDSSVRGMVISAIRYTFTDTLASYDDLLRPIVVDFLTVMVEDREFENRRLALTALNSAAHNKPHLIMPHLERLLPLVYRESVIRPELVREVQMGPFKHKVDDGLEVRKSAYETLYALLETSFSGINPIDFYTRVIAGLEDEHDIRVLCNLMLTKLTVLAKDETLARVDDISEKFKTTLSFKHKDNAVKQELEKHAELVRSTLRASVAVNKECGAALLGDNPAGRGKKWLQYWEWVRGTFPLELRGLEMEETGAVGMGEAY
ncbi:TIP120-domain-containing protein [Terfezia boudieri ATCC MYA-4762]|uniref:TIP120-domain-containing protein n=1 Tax=Terfezia boudieri ATCC MYA-4762 TaxID=1051890 RepID=A0A3N4M7P8_9PEZI|nr:TIP120-domain-containing protein [Terfezia boudieri ATCC MYA-4762]